VFARTLIITSRSTVIINYSVPYQFVGQLLEARSTATTVEIFHRGVRFASHPRSNAAYRHTIISEHRPKSHQAQLEWTPSRLIHWAESVGPATVQIVGTILEINPIRRWAIALASASCAWRRPTPMSAGSGQPARSAAMRLLLSTLALDPEELAGSSALARARQ
jgi:hypothetical protein